MCACLIRKHPTNPTLPPSPGASQELYKLDRFPETLLGRTVKEATGFIFDSCHTVLLAVEQTDGLQRHRMTVGDLHTVRGSSSCCCVCTRIQLMCCRRSRVAARSEGGQGGCRVRACVGSEGVEGIEACVFL